MRLEAVLSRAAREGDLPLGWADNMTPIDDSYPVEWGDLTSGERATWIGSKFAADQLDRLMSYLGVQAFEDMAVEVINAPDPKDALMIIMKEWDRYQQELVIPTTERPSEETARKRIAEFRKTYGIDPYKNPITIRQWCGHKPAKRGDKVSPEAGSPYSVVPNPYGMKTHVIGEDCQPGDWVVVFEV